MGDDQVFGGSACVASQQGANLTLAPNTYYFRKWFSTGESYGTNVSVVLRHTIDDGAVFYLNGTEFHRFNMPQGPVTYAMRASSTRDAICTTETIPISGNLLVVGTNLLAVELHQGTETDQFQIDVWFDLELSLSFRRTPVIPSLNIVRTRVGSVTNVVVSWVSPGGWQLQHGVNLNGPWTNLTSTAVGGTNRYTGNMGTLGPRRFYRLKNP
jgi:hypothetical protein